jgi:hypothetical protein
MCNVSCCGFSSFVSKLLRRKQQNSQNEKHVYFPSPPKLSQMPASPPSDTDSLVTISLSDNEKISPQKKDNTKKTTWKPDFSGKPYRWL